MTKIKKYITIEQKDEEVIDKKALNLSKFVRNKLREEFPDEYE